jgi:uncharacterized protein YdaU (DUF1376 family)
MAPPPRPDPNSYLAICGWDIDRWQNSRAFRRMSMAAQGGYLNLCFSAWKLQPACLLPNDDRELWKLANAPSVEAWRAVKAEVFDTDAWAWTEDGWLNEVVLETYQESAQRHRAAVRSGRIAGRESARVRRALSQAKRIKEDRTTVERPLNDRQPKDRSTAVNPPSPSPSPSQTQGNEDPIGDATRAGITSPPAPATPATLRPGVDFDPSSPLETAVADRCAELAALVARRQGRPPTAKDVRNVLEAVSATPNGKVLDSLIRASNAWLETTLRACDTFERENLDAGGDELDLIDLEEAHAPPPEDPEPIHPGRGKS